MKILSCSSNMPLAKAIAKELGEELTQAYIRNFGDKEIFVEILENVRGEDVFVVQSTCSPANDNLMELLIAIDALKRGSASRITAVIPYFGYARQDRKSGPRTPISAKLVANLLTVAGADRVLTCDLHSAQIQGFFDVPTDNLLAAPLFKKDILENFSQELKSESLIMVSPDVGGVARARHMAERLGTDLAIIDKRRERPGHSQVMNIIGDVSGKQCILIDDIIDSAGTICNAADALRVAGAVGVQAYASHGVFSGKALDTIQNSSLRSIVVGDSILATENVEKASKIRQISLASLMAKAISCIAHDRSISSLFD